MNELALFAGAGGGILGGHLLGWRTVCAVEIEDYPRRVLLQRQADGILPRFPIWDDVCTFDGKPWRGKVDIISGGFPCQDISAAGKGAGISGERSVLWAEMARIIGEVRPSYVLVENSPMLTSRGLGTVLGDLATLGYDAEWGVLGADDAGAPHRRDRIWIVANSNKTGLERPQCARWFNKERREIKDGSVAECGYVSWWKADPADEHEPRLGRMVNGVAKNVDNTINIVYNSNYERKQFFKTGTKEDEAYKNMPNMRRESDEITGSPQGQEQEQQYGGESSEDMSGLPQNDSRSSWGLGAWKNEIEKKYMCDMRGIIHATTLSRIQKEYLVWLGSMLGRAWTAECLEALGKTPRVSTGITNRVDRLAAIGNGQVPQCMALAWKIIKPHR